jgi:anaerobic selenocysteine-containing dehydrogenase
VSWDEALDDIAARLKAIAGADGANAEAIVPTATPARWDGAGREHGGALLPQARRVAARPHDLLVGRRRGARRDLRRQGRHARRALRREPLIVIWGSNSITSNLHFWTLALQARRAGAKLVCIDPRRTDTAEKCHEHIALLPGSDGALALGVMHELIANDWLDHDYIERHVDGWPALRERALAMAAGARAAVVRHPREQVRSLARDYGTIAPAAIRLNYGMQRVRGGGNATRLIALLPCLVGAWRHRAGGLLLSASGWFRNVRDDAALQRPDLLAARRPRTINMSTIGDDLLRQSGELRADGTPLRAADRGARRLQQQPGRGRARVERRSRAASRARTSSRSSSSTS